MVDDKFVLSVQHSLAAVIRADQHSIGGWVAVHRHDLRSAWQRVALG